MKKRDLPRLDDSENLDQKCKEGRPFIRGTKSTFILL